MSARKQIIEATINMHHVPDDLPEIKSLIVHDEIGRAAQAMLRATRIVVIRPNTDLILFEGATPILYVPQGFDGKVWPLVNETLRDFQQWVPSGEYAQAGTAVVMQWYERREHETRPPLPEWIRDWLFS